MAEHSSEAASELERLIADARQARPDAGAEARIAAGVVSVVGVAARVATPSGRSLLAGAAKLTIVAAALGGAVWWVLRPPSRPGPPVAVRAAPAPVVVEQPLPGAVAEPALQTPVASAPRAPLMVRPSPRRASANTSSREARAIAGPADTHASEWQLVSQARQALGADPGTALRLTAEHARLYPRGALVQEREVVAVDALARLGRREEAKARAEAFLRQFPETAHRAHVAALLSRPAP